MDKISRLPDELLVKILSFVPTKVAVSTSVLSKQWKHLWKQVPKLDCDCSKRALRDFACKNLPLRAPIIETLCREFGRASFQREDIEKWIGIAVSHCLRELSMEYYYGYGFKKTGVLFPGSLYTCKSLVILRLEGYNIIVDVPPTVCLPSLKTLQLVNVTYSRKDCLRLLLSHCTVLEDLFIENLEDNVNVKKVVVNVPSLQRLTFKMDSGDASSFSDRYDIVTPSLKYFKVDDDREIFSSLIEHMPKLEEADLSVTQAMEKLLEPITHVKRLSLRALYNCLNVSEYTSGIVFNHLEHLKLCICNDYWSNLLVFMLRNSPKLRVLSLYVDSYPRSQYEQIRWDGKKSSVPECLMKSLETLEFKGYKGRPEERDFLGFLFRNARCLKSTSILR